jgi:transposase
MDIWQAYETSIDTNAQNAFIVQYRFHISQYPNEAADKLRRGERRKLQQTGDDRLRGMRKTLQFEPKNLGDGLTKLQHSERALWRPVARGASRSCFAFFGRRLMRWVAGHSATPGTRGRAAADLPQSRRWHVC